MQMINGRIVMDIKCNECGSMDIEILSYSMTMSNDENGVTLRCRNCTGVKYIPARLGPVPKINDVAPVSSRGSSIQ